MLQKIKLFDSHCHLDDAKLAKDLPAVLERAVHFLIVLTCKRHTGDAI